MFDLKKPCSNCPFRVTQGPLFALHPERLDGVFSDVLFQCHKTLGGEPQQCAGLMSVLHKSCKSNNIMQIAERLTPWRAKNLDYSETYNSTEEAKEGHREPETDKLHEV